MIRDTEEEKSFRGKYAAMLQGKKQDNKTDELENERNEVKQQGMKTPGRRGEQIKHEELDKEIVRRYTLENVRRKAETTN